jgi:putative SOS response-associated peptidase YedK
MCGRFTQLLPLDSLAKRYWAKPAESLDRSAAAARYNVAPTQNALVVRRHAAAAARADGAAEHGDRELALLRWGLIPSWAKDPAIGSKLINARAETVREKPAFRNAFRKHRCLIPCDGFYEWRRTGRIAEPFLFRLDDGGNFALAGLRETWKAPDGRLLESFTIITCAANEILARIHERMPVILPDAVHSFWLDPASSEHALAALLIPFPPDRMTATPLSRAVNNVHSEGPELWTPVTQIPLSY